MLEAFPASVLCASGSRADRPEDTALGGTPSTNTMKQEFLEEAFNFYLYFL